MHSLKLIISIGLLSIYFVLGLVNDAKGDIFYSPDFYTHGAFTNDDFRPADNYFPSDYKYYSNYYQSDRVYYPDYTTMNVNGCYH